MKSFYFFYRQLWTYFTVFSSAFSALDFEQVNVSWVFHVCLNDYPELDSLSTKFVSKISRIIKLEAVTCALEPSAKYTDFF